MAGKWCVVGHTPLCGAHPYPPLTGLALAERAKIKNVLECAAQGIEITRTGLGHPEASFSSGIQVATTLLHIKTLYQCDSRAAPQDCDWGCHVSSWRSVQVQSSSEVPSIYFNLCERNQHESSTDWPLDAQRLMRFIKGIKSIKITQNNAKFIP